MIPVLESSSILTQIPSPDVLLSAFLTLSKKADAPGKVRTGAVLAISIYNLEIGVAHSLSYSFGDPAADSLGGWTRNAPEKIARLHERRQTFEGRHEVTSAESADPKNSDRRLRTYGGAVVFALPTWEFYDAISGGDPLVDEAMAYAIGVKLGLTPPHIPHENQYLSEACALLGCPHVHD